MKVDIQYSVDPVLWNEGLSGEDDTAELVLRTIIPVNQLSIYGAVADMCDELACSISGCSESTGKLVAQSNSETIVMPTEFSTTNKTPQTNGKVQGNLLHDCEQNSQIFQNDQQLIKLCSNVGITKTVARRHGWLHKSKWRHWVKYERQKRRAHVEFS